MRSFQITTLIYDGTVWFCEKFVPKHSRTVDQMIQAARSGRQNIAEGSRAAATSSQTELRLVNVARASLEELLLDFEDFLRHRRLKQWAADSEEAKSVRALASRAGLKNPTDPTERTNHDLYAPWIEHEDPSVRANALICLIHQANYMLDKQIEALEEAFVKDGGYSEQLAAQRLAERTRQKNNPADSAKPSDPIPDCPQCGKPMVLRTARSGHNAGHSFWGCSGYPACKSTQEI